MPRRKIYIILFAGKISLQNFFFPLRFSHDILIPYPRTEVLPLNRELLEKQMGELPIVQYEFFETAELTFSPRVRSVCQLDCPRYGTSWACPPAVGTVEACRERCLAYPRALMLTTMSEVADIADLEGTLAARTDHEEITRRVNVLLQNQGVETYPLSTESCAVCAQCTYPDGPCRHQIGRAHV